MADHTNPMDMPEILLYVAACLTQQDLVTCTYVSRQWHQVFTPCLWKKFQISVNTFLRPSPDVLCKHACQIRKLTLHTTTDLDPFLERLTNLRTLIIIDIGGDQFDKPESWLQLTHLVQRNPRMDWIILGMNRKIGPPASFLRAISASCPNLRRYESSMCLYEDPDQIDALLGIFSQVEEAWTRYETYAVPSVARTYHFPKLVELALKDPRGLCTSRQVDIICMCPNLKFLKWAVGNDKQIPIQEFCERVPLACPKLKNLHVDGSATLPRESIGYMLDSLKDLEELMLFRCEIGESMFRSLARHFHSLTLLDLADSQTKSSMAQRILENCPNLKTVSLALLSMQDVVNGQPWQATGVHHLQVDLVSLEGACRMAAGGNKDSRTIPLQQIRVFEQLAKLTELRRLTIGHWNQLRRPSLEFRLEHGLTLLKSLRKLRHLSLEGTVQDMTEEDVDWLGQNMNLDTMEGRLCSTVAEHETLREKLLTEYQVDVAKRDAVMEVLSIPSGRSGQDPTLDDLFGNDNDEEEYSDGDYDDDEEQMEYEQGAEPGVAMYQGEYDYAVQGEYDYAVQGEYDYAVQGGEDS
ncbi:hypothetical protein CPB97_001277 [Podila verticillata]|nr:hypothetical protein CPB97_001277 [Podila verticillata]